MCQERFTKGGNIDFDGPQFAVVLDAWSGTMVEAMQDAGLDGHTIKSVMMHFSQKIGERDSQIRRDSQRVG